MIMNICITGVSSGIGKKLLEKYINTGNKVYGIVRTKKQKAEIEKIYRDVDIYVCDLSNIEETNKLGKKMKKERFDIMIMNAGYGEYKNFAKNNESEILHQILVNLYSPISLISNYLENSIVNNTKIVLISSIVGSMPIKKLSIYGASKGGLSHFYRVFKKENPDIPSLCIELGSTKTPMHIKAGMKKSSGKELDRVCNKIIKTIERKEGIRYLYIDWWLVAKVGNIIK